MTKSLVQQQFGAHAAAYATSTVHAKGASLARLVDLVRPEKHWRALDIATGAGHTAAAFAPHIAHVIASDITAEMLAEARKLATSKGFANMETATADAQALPFPDAQFDLVTSRIAPHHFPDVGAFVREVHRVLRPGGTFALVDNIAPDAESTPGFSADELERAASAYNAFEKVATQATAAASAWPNGARSFPLPVSRSPTRSASPRTWSSIPGPRGLALTQPPWPRSARPWPMPAQHSPRF